MAGEKMFFTSSRRLPGVGEFSPELMGEFHPELVGEFGPEYTAVAVFDAAVVKNCSKLAILFPLSACSVVGEGHGADGGR